MVKKGVSLIIIIFILVGCGGEIEISTSPKSNVKSKKISSALKLMHKQNLLNGCVLVTEGNDIIFNDCFGFANFEKKDSLQVDSRFRLCGLSLQMTAMSVMILESKGLLGFNDDISKYLPELPYKGITIRHCLQHIGGLPDYMWMLEEIEKEEGELFYNKDVLELVVEKAPPVHFQPGTSWEYSELGYVLIPLIVEKISGISFRDFMQENIFSPLDMTNTLMASGTGDNKVNGYDANKKQNDFHKTNGIVGDGGVISTIEDIYKWDQALYSEKLVKREVLAEASRPYRLNNDQGKGDYGFGVYIYNYEGVITLEHGGNWLGFHNYMMRDLTNKNLITILTNQNQDPSILMAVINDILETDEEELVREEAEL